MIYKQVGTEAGSSQVGRWMDELYNESTKGLIGNMDRLNLGFYFLEKLADTCRLLQLFLLHSLTVILCSAGVWNSQRSMRQNWTSGSKDLETMSTNFQILKTRCHKICC